MKKENSVSTDDLEELIEHISKEFDILINNPDLIDENALPEMPREVSERVWKKLCESVEKLKQGND